MERHLELDRPMAVDPRRLWDLISELDGYPRWNPWILEVAERRRGRRRVRFAMASGARPRVTVSAVVDDETMTLALRYRSGLAGLFDVTHRLQVVAIDAYHARLRQELSASGLLVPPAWQFVAGDLERGMESTAVAARLGR